MEGDTLSLLARLRAEANRLGSDLTELLAARVELARLELELSAFQLRRLAWTLAGLGTLVLSGAVLLILLVVELLEPVTGMHRHVCLALCGFLLAGGGIAAIWVVVRRFRRKFTGLTGSLAELREDVAWIRQWREELSGD